MRLYRFLYLDVDAVADFLSQLLGGVPEGSIDTVSKGSKGLSVGGGVSGFEARGSKENLQEQREALRVTDESRFRTLYEILSEKEAIQPLGAFDPGIISQFGKGEVVEVDAMVSIGRMHKFLEGTSKIAGFARMVEAVGVDVSEADNDRLDVFRRLSEQISAEPVPILFQAVDTAKVMFGAALRREYVRGALKELEGECTVLGTVRRVVPKGKEHSLWSAVPDIDPSLILPLQNRAERRMAGSKRAGARVQKKEDQFEEKVEGPGVVLMPIAVYR